MLKTAFTLAFIAFSMTGYSQKSTLLQNINFRAKELKHNLNKVGDSLVLRGERRIYSVEIFSQNFEKIIEVEGKATKIPLNDIPLGRHVVLAKLADKRIVLTLLRHKEIEKIPEIPKPEIKITSKPDIEVVSNPLNKKPLAEAIHTKIENIVLDSITSKITKSILKDIKEVITDATTTEPELSSSSSETTREAYIDKHAQLLSKGPRKQTIQSSTYYWIKYEVNNGNSSYKTMNLVDNTVMVKIVKKHKFELKTILGKNNHLTVWEIYNASKFMKAQIANPDYINALSSDLFNVNPYYCSASTSSSIQK